MCETDTITPHASFLAALPENVWAKYVSSSLKLKKNLARVRVVEKLKKRDEQQQLLRVVYEDFALEATIPITELVPISRHVEQIQSAVEVMCLDLDDNEKLAGLSDTAKCELREILIDLVGFESVKAILITKIVKHRKV